MLDQHSGNGLTSSSPFVTNSKKKFFSDWLEDLLTEYICNPTTIKTNLGKRPKNKIKNENFFQKGGGGRPRCLHLIKSIF